MWVELELRFIIIFLQKKMEESLFFVLKTPMRRAQAKNLCGGSAEAWLLDPANLPLGISKDGAVVPKTNCSSTGCTAYMGYVILPDVTIRNLYQVRFVVVNSSDTSVKWETSYYITVK